MSILWALALAFAGGLNFRVDHWKEDRKGYLKNWLTLVVLGLVAAVLIALVADTPIAATPWRFGWLVFWFWVANFILTAIAEYDHFYYHTEIEVLPLVPFFWAVIAIAALLVILAAHSFWTGTLPAELPA